MVKVCLDEDIKRIESENKAEVDKAAADKEAAAKADKKTPADEKVAVNRAVTDEKVAADKAPTAGWKEIEKSPMSSRLGDAVRSLKKLPLKYMQEDLKLLVGDAYDNAPATFGPDNDGMWYRIDHKRMVSFPQLGLGKRMVSFPHDRPGLTS